MGEQTERRDPPAQAAARSCVAVARGPDRRYEEHADAIRHSSTVRLVQPTRGGPPPGGPGGLPAGRRPGRGAAWDDGRRMAHLGRRPRRHPLRTARPDRRGQLRRSGARLALPDREPRAAPRLLPADHAPDDRRRALHHGRQPSQRGRHRRGHRRAPVDVPPRRGRARRAVRAAALGPRRRLLDRRRRRRADLFRHHRLPARGAGCEDRLAGPRLRRRRRRRLEAEQRPGPGPDHERAGLERRSGRGRRHRHRGRREPLRQNAAQPPQRQGLRARLRRPHGRAPLDLPHHPAAGRVRERDVGGRLVGVHRQHRRVDPDDRRHRAGHRLPAGRDPHQRLLRRAPARRQPVLREPGRGRRRDRRADLALPVRPSSRSGTTTSRAPRSSPTSPSTAAR